MIVLRKTQKTKYQDAKQGYLINRDGGSEGCCYSTIINSDISCDNNISPCIITQPDPTCNNGIINNNVCCMLSCGTCGGNGCGNRDGGSQGCCMSPIRNSGLL